MKSILLLKSLALNPNAPAKLGKINRFNRLRKLSRSPPHKLHVIIVSSIVGTIVVRASALNGGSPLALNFGIQLFLLPQKLTEFVRG
jgi:hypothetical protein